MQSQSAAVLISYARWVARRLAAACLIGGAIGIFTAHAADTPTDMGPSFPCNASNNAVEAAICSHPDLASRDRTMAVLFAAAHRDAFDRGVSQQPALQRQWIQSRNEQCSGTGTGTGIQACLVASYDPRLWDLAVATLFRTPDTALAELARQKPDAARLYEAIYRYATTQNKRQRADEVASLIAPAFDVVRGKPWGSPLEGVRSPQDVAASDKNFSLFLIVVSASDERLTLPCAAVVRRPGLIQALDSAYGSSMDGRLIRSDCSAMTPALSALDRLKDAAVKVQPACEGTIRFSLARDFAKTLVAVRLHRMDLLKASKRQMMAAIQNVEANAENKEVGESKFIALHTEDILHATHELATYYARQFNMSPAVAKTQATLAVQAVISRAYSLCEVY